MCFLEVVVETEVQRLTTEVEAKAALDTCSLEDGVSIAIAEETHVAHKGELVGQVYRKAGLLLVRFYTKIPTFWPSALLFSLSPVSKMRPTW